MPQPNKFDEPGSPGGTEPKKPLEFPRREGNAHTINVWRVTLYTVAVIVVLALLTWWIVQPK